LEGGKNEEEIRGKGLRKVLKGGRIGETSRKREATGGGVDEKGEEGLAGGKAVREEAGDPGEEKHRKTISGFLADSGKGIIQP